MSLLRWFIALAAIFVLAILASGWVF